MAAVCLRTRWESILVIAMLLVCQAWRSTAEANGQQSTETREREPLDGIIVSEIAVTANTMRALKEFTPSQNGWRADLVHEHHRVETLKGLSKLEKLKRGVFRSLARAENFESRARKVSSKRSRPEGRELQSSKSYESTVSFTGGDFSMAFSLGTPPQHFVGLADTGSDLIWVQSADCDRCYNSTAPPFDPSLSSTYSTLSCASSGCDVLKETGSFFECTPQQVCQYGYSYGGSMGAYTIGDLSTDVFSINTTKGTKAGFTEVKFGLGLNQSEGFIELTDGFVGLGRGPLSFPSQIKSNLGQGNYKFSYCLVDYLISDSTSPIIFGAAAEPGNLSADFSFTPLLTPFNVSEVPFYYVSLLDIKVGGAELSIPASAVAVDLVTGDGGVILDSGTSFTTLNTVVYKMMVSKFTGLLEGAYEMVDLEALTGFPVCYNMTGLDNISIPGIIFVFDNAPFILGIDNVIVRIGIETQTYFCLAFLEAPPGVALNVIGNTQQLDFLFIYDLDKSCIGWLQLDCSTLSTEPTP